MSEENNNSKMSEAKSTADETKKLSEDARGLGPMQAGPFAIGRVDAIVGEGGLEVPGFVATRNEAGAVFGQRNYRSRFRIFLYGCTGSSDWRTRAYANRRLNTIAEAIGEKVVKEAFRQAEEDIGKKVDARPWKIFMEGTKEEQERFQEEVQEELARNPEKGRIKAGAAYSRENLERAYQMYEQGSTHFAVMNETGLDVLSRARNSLTWILDLSFGGVLGGARPLFIRRDSL